MNNDKLREAANELAEEFVNKYLHEPLRSELIKSWGDRFVTKLTPLFHAPEPVDDKALAAALAWADCELTADEFSKKHISALHARRRNESEYSGDVACRILAQALRAAQQEVKKLRQDNDDHAESWALCGIPHESQLTKILVQQDEIQKLKREVAELREWKRQCLEVWNSWDVQAVGKLLGVPLGKSIHPAIVPGIEALQSEVAELRKDKERLDWVSRLFENCPHAEIHFNDDPDQDYWPVGYTIFVAGCEPLKVTAPSLCAAIDKARAAGEGNRPLKCPQCGDPVIQPSNGDNYCESCGWPDENREDDLADRVTDAVLAVVCTEGHDPEERDQIKKAVESVLAGDGKGAT